MTMDVTASLGHGVRWAGAQRDVLGGDISGRVDLAELAAIPDLYGLVVTTEAWNVRACFPDGRLTCVCRRSI